MENVRSTKPGDFEVVLAIEVCKKLRGPGLGNVWDQSWHREFLGLSYAGHDFNYSSTLVVGKFAA